MELFKSCFLALLLLLIMPLAFAKNSCSTSIDGIYATQGISNQIPGMDQDWTKISLPDNWRTRWPKYTDGVWYRINWQLTCNKQDISLEYIALTVNRITMAGKAFVNQDLIWQDNSLAEPLSRSWNKPLYWHIPSSSIHIGQNYFYIYIVASPESTAGLGEIALGNSKSILNIYEYNTWAQRTIFIINLCLSITLGGICFCIWLFRRKEEAFGWYGLSTLFWSIFIYNILMTETYPLPDTYTFMRVNIACLLSYIFCFCLFTWRFLNRSYPACEQLFFIINAIFLIIIIFIPNHSLKLVIDIAFYVNFIIFFMNVFFISYIAFKIKSLEAWLLSFAIFGCLFLCAIDLLSALKITSFNVLLLPYTSTFIAIFLTITLALNLTNSLKKIETFNEDLNYKIVQTSNTLSLSLKQQYQLALENNLLQTRLKLSYELHDGLGSTLTQAITTVNYHKELNFNKTEVLAMLKTLNYDLRQIVDVFKGNQQQLPENPTLLLAPLRHRFNILLNELSIEVTWHITPEWKEQPNGQICSVLYRILEEALSNIIKHSYATSVEISLSYQNNAMLLKIQDNGVGFNVDSIFSSGISVGLLSMKNRAEQVNGQITISSKPQQTILTITI